MRRPVPQGSRPEREILTLCVIPLQPLTIECAGGVTGRYVGVFEKNTGQWLMLCEVTAQECLLHPPAPNP